MNKFVVEFFGTMLLLFSIVISYSTLNPPNSIVFVAIAYMLLIFVGAKYSGAHYNPAITIAVLIRGKITSEHAFIYMLLQLLGALIGAFLGRLIVENIDTGILPIASTELDFLQALKAELLGSFLLAFVMVQSRTIAKPVNKYIYGILMGLTLAGSIYFLSQYSGGAFNPAVGLGVCAVNMAYWSDIWLFVIPTFGAGALAALVYLIWNRDA